VTCYYKCDNVVTLSNPHACPNLMKLNFFDRFSRQTQTSSGIRVVPCGQTDGKIDRTKLIVGFCNFEKAPKKICCEKFVRDILRKMPFKKYTSAHDTL
jgi:hypothetical protein